MMDEESIHTFVAQARSLSGKWGYGVFFRHYRKGVNPWSAKMRPIVKFFPRSGVTTYQCRKMAIQALNAMSGAGSHD